MTSLDILKLTDKRKGICEALGFSSVEEILSYYPSRYEVNYLNKKEDYIKGSRVTFIGRITSSPALYRFGARQSVVRFKCLNQNGDEINCSLFNRPWATSLKKDQKIIVTATVDSANKVNVINYYYESKKAEVFGIKPVYSAKEGVSQSDIKSLINSTLKKMKGKLVDDIPKSLVLSHKLVSYEEAINYIHNPKNDNEYKLALARLKYEEFLNFYLSLYMRQETIANKKAKDFDLEKINELIASLDFELTKDQLSTIKEILIDLKSDRIMNRLVQGDVGCGKTIVAIVALYANYLAGYQGAFMAPTEILAKQHFRSIKEILGKLDIRVELLCSTTKNKKAINEALIKNEIDILVGTHALFSDDVKMNNLGLAITDEQQRFGVNQRKKLLAKGDNADFLLMSATPIPRTLASAIYGDMAISSIYSMPSGRKGADTYLIEVNTIDGIKDDLKDILDRGRQIYIIASAIDKSATGTIDATSLFEELKEVFLPYKTGLLHGRLSTDEKEEVMRSFNDNEIQILITTTVVEVGVNVKNATCMVVYNAERFGLSQLHQLRGRIQRSIYRGSFYLLCDEPSEEVKKRLEVLVKTNDGFRIAEEDLKLRGPGDLLGTRQSGLPSFILGDILNDRIFIDAAQKDAHFILNDINNKEYQALLKKAKENAIDSLG